MYAKRIIIGGALALFTASCSCRPSIVPLETTVVAPQRVDFGRAPAGAAVMRSLQLENRGRASVVLDSFNIIASDAPFAAAVTSVSLPAGSTVDVELRWLARGPSPGVEMATLAISGEGFADLLVVDLVGEVIMSPPDAGPPDAGVPDAGPTDAGPPRCQQQDAGLRVVHQMPIGLYGGTGAMIAVAGDGTVYLAENLSTPRVSRVDPSGADMVVVPPPMLGGATGIAWDAQRARLLIADGRGNGNSGQAGSNKVWSWDSTNGLQTFIASIANPVGIAVSGTDVFVASFADRRVYQYTATGTLVGALGPQLSEHPAGLVVARDGAVIVSGYALLNNTAFGTRLYRIDRNGQLTTFANPGMSDPYALALDPSGTLWASYYNWNRLVRFEADGGFITYPGGWTSDDAVNGIGFDNAGTLYFTVNGGRTTSQPALLKVPGVGPRCD